MVEKIPLKFGMEMRKRTDDTYSLWIVRANEFGQAVWEEIEDYIRGLAQIYELNIPVDDYLAIFKNVHEVLSSQRLQNP